MREQLVITNPISDVLFKVAHVEDIAKTVRRINNRVQQINALTQQLQQIQAYVKGIGDPDLSLGRGVKPRLKGECGSAL